MSNSSTSNSEHRAWARFWRTFLGVVLVTIGTVYAFLALVDGWGSLPFSLPLARAPADPNQRFSYPMLARDPRFDSLVIGTSTTRLLRPDLLNEALGGTFANLSMNSAVATEQMLLAELFLRRPGPPPRTLIVGIDIVWCAEEQSYNASSSRPNAASSRPFPLWLYDETPWNDYFHLFHARALAVAAKQLAIALGFAAPRYGADGYAADFVPPQADYDLARAREHIYGDGPRELSEPGSPLAIDATIRAGWTFPALALLADLAARLPDETRLIALLVPYHAAAQRGLDTIEGQYWRECRRRIADILSERPAGGLFVDFMRRSPITMDDENYWDRLHYNTAVADLLVDLLADALAGRESANGSYILNSLN